MTSPSPLLKLPSAFWVSIDPANPIAEWNALQVGYLASAAFTACSVDKQVLTKYLDGSLQYLRFVENPEHDVPVMAQHHMSVTNEYLVEHNAEVARRKIDPLLPSRLSAVFAFGTKKDAVIAARSAGRPAWSVHAFELVDSPLTRVHRANMHVVSLMRTAARVASFAATELDSVWNHYWSGGGELTIEFPGQGLQRRAETAGVMWEYLIEGALTRLDRRH